MFIKRSTFFFLLLLIVITPFISHTLWWLAHSIKTMGSMRFVGKNYTGQIVHTYSVIRFFAGRDTVFFNTNDNIIFTPGEAVPVRYRQHNPAGAKVDMFVEIWGDALVYGGMFVLLVLIVFLHPGIVPYRSKIWMAAEKPFLRVV